MQYLFARIRLNYGQKLFLVATLPLILTALAIWTLTEFVRA